MRTGVTVQLTPEDRARLEELIEAPATGKLLGNEAEAAVAEVPQHMQDDPDLWSDCISRAYQERSFLCAFEASS